MSNRNIISSSEDSDAEPKQQSSDDEPKPSKSRKSSGSDSDVVKKPKKRAVKSNAKVVESGSSGSDSDGEVYRPETSKKRKAIKIETGRSKKSKLLNSSDEEGHERRVDDFDDDMILDDEDRERLNMMSEKDREIEIFKRIEQRELLKAREEIKKKLNHKNESSDDEKSKKKKKQKKAEKSKKEHKKSKVEVDSDAEDFMAEEITATKKSKNRHASSEDEVDMAYHRPSEVAKKQTTKKALDDLKNRRKEKREADEKRKQQAERAALDIDDVFGLDGDGEEKSSSSKSSPSRSRSQSSSSDGSNQSRDSSPEVKPEISSVNDLKRIRLSRFKLSQWCHYPFFNSLVIGCFVRIQIGVDPSKQQPIYRVAQIKEVVETAKVYALEKTRTNKGLRLQHGADSKVFRMMFVSNSEFLEQEYQKWAENMKKNGFALPTLQAVEAKAEEIRKALTYQMTEQDVDYMIKEKARFKSDPVNSALLKSELQKRKLQAEQTGDIDEAARLQAEIDEIDQRTGEVDRKRTERIQSIAWINQRNREKMKEVFLTQAAERKGIDVEKEDDPFTRKSGRMKVVAGSTKDKDKLFVDANKMHKSASAPNFAAAAAAKSQLKIDNDLKDAHDIDIDIDFKLPFVLPVSTIPHARLDPPESSYSRQQPPTSTGPKKTLTLDEWRRRKAMNMGK